VRASEQAAALYRELTAASPEQYLRDLAAALGNRAAVATQLGDLPRAADLLEEAVGLLRRQPTTDIISVELLAEAMNNLAVVYRGRGRLDDAMEAATQAVRLYRDLADRDQRIYGRGLAGGLRNFAIAAATLGLRAQALEALGESLALLRLLASTESDASSRDLAATLNNYSVTAASLGWNEEALAAIEEAIALRRQLAAARPDAFPTSPCR
jgi:tetratricopeptide (TPR) repeat protein